MVENEFLIGVILYQPTDNDLNNISALADKFPNLVGFANSVVPDIGSRFRKVGTGENVGVAAAYNVICSLAEERELDYIVLLDQDSEISPEILENFIKKAKREFDQNSRLAAIGAEIVSGQKDDLTTPYILTSGTVYRTSALRQIGYFDEGLFIDEVEIQAHLRLFDVGWHILSLEGYKFVHKLGDPVSISLFGVSISSTNHSSLRRYYMTRNRLYTRKHNFRADVRNINLLIVKEALRILLVEKQKLKKLKFMLLGVLDYLRGIKGKFDAHH